jgi:hypothetical protein
MSTIKSSLRSELKNAAESQDRLELRNALLSGAHSPIIGKFDADYFASLRRAIAKAAFKALPEQ